MPVIKSAIKKMRKDKKRESANNLLRASIDRAVRGAKKTKTAKDVSTAISLVDKGVKNKLLPANRAARIKSQLSKLAKPATKASKPKTETKKPAAKTKKPAAAKASSKSK